MVAVHSVSGLVAVAYTKEPREPTATCIKKGYTPNDRRGYTVSNVSQALKKAPAATAEPKAQPKSEIGRVVRLFSRFLVGQRGSFIMAALMLVIESLTAVLMPLLVFKYFIDGYLSPRIDQLAGRVATGPVTPLQSIGLTIVNPDVDIVVVIAIGVVVLTMVNSLADSLAEIFLARSGQTLGYNIRVALYEHLQKLSMAFHNQKRTGDVLTRVTSDVTALEDFVIKSLSDIAGSILLIIFTLYVMLVNAWQVAIVAVLIIPVMALISNYFAQRIKSASKKQRSREGELASAAQEMLASIRVIQSFGRGGYELQRFAEQNKKNQSASFESARLQSTFSWVVSVLESVAVALTICLGVWLIFGNVGGAIGVGLLATFIKYIQDMFKPTKKIIKEWNTFGKVYASVERIGDLLDRKPAVLDMPNAAPAPPFRGDVMFRNVSFAYQPEPEEGKPAPELRLALRNVNLHITQGEVVALVGSSGAGKSTILQLLPRLYDPHMGQVLIDGHDLREYTLDTVRSQMSMVLQDTILFTGTVADNIAYGRPEASREEIIAAAIQASAHDFIQKLPNGYETVLGERAGNLSGGQRQRIAIARAFIRNSPILVLDEPTTGLDAESTDLVLLALRTLMKGKSTLIVSHDLNLIRHADKIVFVKLGEIAEIGTHKELLKLGGLYASLYSKQFGDAEAKAAQAEEVVVPASIAAEIDDDEESSVTSKAFQTLVTKVVPRPISAEAFHTLMTQAVPVVSASASAPVAAPVQAIASVQPAAVATPSVSAPIQQPVHAAMDATVIQAPSAAQPAARATNGPTQPAKPQPAKPEPAKLEPAKAQPPLNMPNPTVVLPAQALGAMGIPEPPADPRSTMRIPELTAAFKAVTAAADQHLVGAQVDPLSSPTLQRELPALRTALDGAQMREHLQNALFGRNKAIYTIESCEPGKASYLDGEGCVLRYELQVRRNDSGGMIKPLVVGRLFRDQMSAAIFMRDRLQPVASLMRGRPELAPYAAPVAMIEPLTMVVHVFPIDGELTTLAAATDRSRVVEVFNEALPEAVDDRFTAQDCKIEIAQYARRHRCVLRYIVNGKDEHGAAQQRVVYGKISVDNQTAEVAPVMAALEKRLGTLRNHVQFRIPQYYGFRPDLQMALLEGLPGKPQINQLLKARLGGQTSNGGLSLEDTLDSAGRIAATLHATDIRLGNRRSFETMLGDLRRELRPIQRISPELGAHLNSLLLRIEAYAAESDSLAPVFCHGDYTYSQILFDGRNLGLVDFDTVCQAEPAFDLGHFMAYLRIAVRKGKDANAELANQLGDRFLDAYMAAAQVPAEDRERLRVRVAVYQVVSLIRMAIHRWTQLKGGRLETVLKVIEEEMACLPQLEY